MRIARRTPQGFTLIELVIVVAIIAVLAGSMVPLFFANKLEAQKARASADLNAIKTAALLLHADTGKYPLTAVDTIDSTGRNLITNNDSYVNWNGPYMDDWRRDPFSTDDSPVTYRLRTVGNRLFAQCFGSDHADDIGADDDQILLITNDITR